MFKKGDIVEPKETGKDMNSRYLKSYPDDYYQVIDVGIGNMTIVPMNDGYQGLNYYVDYENWQLNKTYLRGLKLKKICSRLEK